MTEINLKDRIFNERIDISDEEINKFCRKCECSCREFYGDQYGGYSYLACELFPSYAEYGYSTDGYQSCESVRQDDNQCGIHASRFKPIAGVNKEDIPLAKIVHIVKVEFDGRDYLIKAFESRDSVNNFIINELLDELYSTYINENIDKLRIFVYPRVIN